MSVSPYPPSRHNFNRYIINENEVLVAPNVPNAPVDCQGVELKVGDHVAWSIGGRDNSGLSFGVLTELGYPKWVEYEHVIHNHKDSVGDFHSVAQRMLRLDTPRHKVAALRKGRKGVERSGSELVHYVVGPADG